MRRRTKTTTNTRRTMRRKDSLTSRSTVKRGRLDPSHADNGTPFRKVIVRNALAEARAMPN
jgi:hypothetical protein